MRLCCAVCTASRAKGQPAQAGETRRLAVGSVTSHLSSTTQVQGRLNDLGMLAGAHAARGPDGTITPDAAALLERLARQVTLSPLFSPPSPPPAAAYHTFSASRMHAKPPVPRACHQLSPPRSHSSAPYLLAAPNALHQRASRMHATPPLPRACRQLRLSCMRAHHRRRGWRTCSSGRTSSTGAPTARTWARRSARCSPQRGSTSCTRAASSVRRMPWTMPSDLSACLGGWERRRTPRLADQQHIGTAPAASTTLRSHTTRHDALAPPRQSDALLRLRPRLGPICRSHVHLRAQPNAAAHTHTLAPNPCVVRVWGYQTRTSTRRFGRPSCRRRAGT